MNIISQVTSSFIISHESALWLHEIKSSIAKNFCLKPFLRQVVCHERQFGHAVLDTGNKGVSLKEEENMS